ncbi:MAG: CRISPR-associated helicase Cas3', partial [Hyphomicrobium sp.]
DASRPSLVLAHGKRMLNDAFTDTILDIAQSADGYEEGGGTVCRAWIADDRRKVFLAEVGIGTVDQALLGVLPTRHQALRLWGLADRVLVIDEAHAYDAYMSRELETLLEFHAALGGSAIVLSATLPAMQRRNLEGAFARGLGVRLEPASEIGYPLLTQVSGDGRFTQQLATRPDRTRSLQVRRIASFEAAVDHVAAMAAQGAAVAWIRNAVDDVLDAADALRQRRIEPVILHARFAMGDRLAIEQRVRETLGPDGTSSGRHGVVVVGSQILEQSLDYDVDAMVTDLAPVDLVVQRAGRLWRHPGRTVRPLAAPELCVLAPDPTVVETRDWYRQVSPRAAAVYGHHGLVWRSARELFERGAIATPDGVRDLVEAVYGIENYDDIPAALIRSCLDADGRRGAARSVAGANLLDVWDGYGGSSNIWSRDTVTPTRLGDPVTVFRLGRVENGTVVPWYPDANPARAWALSEASLSSRKATGVPKLDAAGERRIAAAKAGWPAWEQDMPLLVLEHDDGGWRGRSERLGVSQIVGYSPIRGIQMLSGG